jgi:hypothetical protein
MCSSEGLVLIQDSKVTTEPRIRGLRRNQGSQSERTTMGSFVYDTVIDIEMDDRTLAHLQIVILNKLRRAESFAFSWKTPATHGDGRSTVWMHPGVSMLFRYAGSRPPRIDPEWLRVLTETANSSSGLQLVPEPTRPH